jgi:protein-S-isoprenylcysteine O-methyltransferase Ste14/phosphohistidine phosphatase SixA
MFQRSLEGQVATPRTWRVLLALLLAPFALNAFLSSGWMAEAFGPGGEEFWDFLCLGIAAIGLGMRMTIAGYGQSVAVDQNAPARSMPVTGFYSIVRHPVYIANYLILFSWVLLFKSALFAVLAAAVACLYYERLILAKERALCAAYGNAFRNWAQKTPAILANFANWSAPEEKFDFTLALRREALTFALIGLMFFSTEALEGVVIEQEKFLSWLMHEVHWATLLAVSLAIVWTQLSRVWSILLFVLSSLALGGVGAGRSLVRESDHRQDALNALAAGGHVLLLRHGSTIGSDAQQVQPYDCTTQRNLSEQGRDQARGIGILLREQNVNLAKVVSSQFCRCRETAAMIAARQIETMPDLNEKPMHVTLVERIFGNGKKDEEILRPTRAMIAGWKEDGTLLVVSHAPIIAGLTHENLDTGEGLVLKPSPDIPMGFTVIGKISRER